MITTRAASQRLLVAAEAPIDAASLAVFRVLFGLLGFTSSLRFMAEGWIEVAFIEPTFHFHFFGFEWVKVLPPAAMYAAFGLITLTSVMVMLGLFYRVAITTFFVVFTYVEMIDVTNYLNHYYLVSLLAFLLCFMPLGRTYGLDARRRPDSALYAVPAWMVWALRFQISVVYFYAALAKTGPDWLLHGQPMGLWLHARTDIPLIGSLFALPSVPLVMSWGGFLYDLSVPFAMLWSRTRPYAFIVAIGFHTMVGVLFNIGMFPWIMLASLTVFFCPAWPRRWIKLPNPKAHLPVNSSVKYGRIAASLVGATLLFQAIWPARAYAYGGDVMWHEQGMRFAWKVMVREKNGSVMYRVKSQRWQREQYIPPSRYLTVHQEREMSSQPDQILQLAHHIHDDLTSKGHQNVEVRVDALVSLNGRKMQPMISPEVDLTTIQDGLSPAAWITEAPTQPPPQLRRH